MQNRKGFTLIELLIVVVIIGHSGRDRDPEVREHEAAGVCGDPEVDLRNLVVAEEAYFSEQTTYTTALATTQFDASQGVTYSVTNASGTGWEATATHVGLVGATPSGCHIAIGTYATTGSESEGAPYCP